MNAKTLVAVSVLVFGLTGCSKKTIENIYPGRMDMTIAGDFDRIDASLGGDLTFRQAEGQAKATMRVPGWLTGEVEMKVTNGTLTVRPLHDNVRNEFGGGEGLVLEVVAPTLAEVSLAGAWNMTVDGKLDVDKLAFDVSGASSVAGNGVVCTQFEAGLSGTSVPRMGSVDTGKMSVEASGRCVMEVGKVAAKTLSIDMSGASAADVQNVNVADVDIDASGSTAVTIAGTAKTASYDASGASKISAGGCVAASVEADASGASRVVCNAGDVLKTSKGMASSVECKGNPRVVSEE